MAAKVFIDGTMTDAETARVSVFDRGFLYGDSVYEVLRTAGGRVVDLTPHMERLARSAAAIALPLPKVEDIVNAVHATLEAAANEDSYIRVVVTRGAGEIGLDTSLADTPSTIIIVRPLQLPTREMMTQGVALQIVEVVRTSRRSMDPSVKSGNYLNNILALQQARLKGAYEALMCNADGYVAEGSSSNVFVVHGEVVGTPPIESGLLAGITRQRVLELLREQGIDGVEREMKPDHVRSADEVFLTSSIRGVLPVATVDGAPLGRPLVGPCTRKVMDAYARFLAQHAVTPNDR